MRAAASSRSSISNQEPSGVLGDIGEAKGHAWNRSGTIIYGRNDTVALHGLSVTGETRATPMAGVMVSDATLRTAFPSGWTAFPLLCDGGGGLCRGSEWQPPRRLLSADSGAVYHPAGYLLFVRDRTLLAQPFDATTLDVRGEPVRVAQQAIVYKNTFLRLPLRWPAIWCIAPPQTQVPA